VKTEQTVSDLTRALQRLSQREEQLIEKVRKQGRRLLMWASKYSMFISLPSGSGKRRELKGELIQLSRDTSLM